MDGVIVVNKPQNFTSFDVVAICRRLCGQRKIGHTGTLDPMATGVLPLLLGNATKAQDILPDSDKEYIAQFKLGITTDTLDIWGQVKSEAEFGKWTEKMQELIPRFTGEIEQLPPMYSAVQKNGVRLYDLARQGIEVEREKRIVTISKLELLDCDEKQGTGKLCIACSKGTYIRTLIDDLGKELGCGSVMTSLVRTRACGFSLEDAISLDDLKILSDEGKASENTKKLLCSSESLFREYRLIRVSPKQTVRFANGNPLDISKTTVASSAADGEIFRIGSRTGEFLGLGKAECESGLIKVYKLFPNTENSG